MATSEESCDGNPNFAIICSFITKFGDECGIRVSIPDLQQMLEDTKNAIPEELKELHIHLLRKGRKRVNKEKWERSLIKFCHEYSSVDAWELERFGYKKAKLSVKLELLKRLLELQFDSNAKFKAEVNKHDAGSLRVLPIGRDINGHNYWYQLDHDYNMRLYRQDASDESSWHLLCTSTEDLRQVICCLAKESVKGDINLSDIAKLEFTPDSDEKVPTDLDVKEEVKKENGERPVEDLTASLSLTKPCAIIIKTEKKESGPDCQDEDRTSSETSEKPVVSSEKNAAPSNEGVHVEVIKSPQRDNVHRTLVTEATFGASCSSSIDCKPTEVPTAAKSSVKAVDADVCTKDLNVSLESTASGKLCSSVKQELTSDELGVKDCEKAITNQTMGTSSNVIPDCGVNVSVEPSVKSSKSIEGNNVVESSFPVERAIPTVITDEAKSKSSNVNVTSHGEISEVNYRGSKIMHYQKWNSEKRKLAAPQDAHHQTTNKKAEACDLSMKSMPSAECIPSSNFGHLRLSTYPSSEAETFKRIAVGNTNTCPDFPMDLSKSNVASSATDLSRTNCPAAPGHAVGSGHSTKPLNPNDQDHISVAKGPDSKNEPLSRVNQSRILHSTESILSRPFKKKHHIVPEENAKDNYEQSRHSVIFEVKNSKLIPSCDDGNATRTAFETFESNKEPIIGCPQPEVSNLSIDRLIAPHSSGSRLCDRVPCVPSENVKQRAPDNSLLYQPEDKCTVLKNNCDNLLSKDTVKKHTSCSDVLPVPRTSVSNDSFTVTENMDRSVDPSMQNKPQSNIKLSSNDKSSSIVTSDKEPNLLPVHNSKIQVPDATVQPKLSPSSECAPNKELSGNVDSAVTISACATKQEVPEKQVTEDTCLSNSKPSVDSDSALQKEHKKFPDVQTEAILQLSTQTELETDEVSTDDSPKFSSACENLADPKLDNSATGTDVSPNKLGKIQCSDSTDEADPIVKSPDGSTVVKDGVDKLNSLSLNIVKSPVEVVASTVKSPVEVVASTVKSPVEVVAPTVKSPIEVACSSGTAVKSPVQAADSTGSAIKSPVQAANSTGSAIKSPVEAADSTGSAVKSPVEVADSTGSAVNIPVEVADSTGSAVKSPVEAADSTGSAVKSPVEVADSGASVKTVDVVPDSSASIKSPVEVAAPGALESEVNLDVTQSGSMKHTDQNSVLCKTKITDEAQETSIPCVKAKDTPEALQLDTPPTAAPKVDEHCLPLKEQVGNKEVGSESTILRNLEASTSVCSSSLVKDVSEVVKDASIPDKNTLLPKVPSDLSHKLPTESDILVKPSTQSCTKESHSSSHMIQDILKSDEPKGAGNLPNQSQVYIASAENVSQDLSELKTDTLLDKTGTKRKLENVSSEKSASPTVALESIVSEKSDDINKDLLLQDSDCKVPSLNTEVSKEVKEKDALLCDSAANDKIPNSERASGEMRFKSPQDSKDNIEQQEKKAFNFKSSDSLILDEHCSDRDPEQEHSPKDETVKVSDSIPLEGVSPQEKCPDLKTEQNVASSEVEETKSDCKDIVSPKDSTGMENCSMELSVTKQATANVPDECSVKGQIPSDECNVDPAVPKSIEAVDHDEKINENQASESLREKEQAKDNEEHMLGKKEAQESPVSPCDSDKPSVSITSVSNTCMEEKSAESSENLSSKAVDKKECNAEAQGIAAEEINSADSNTEQVVESQNGDGDKPQKTCVENFDVNQKPETESAEKSVSVKSEESDLAGEKSDVAGCAKGSNEPDSSKETKLLSKEPSKDPDGDMDLEQTTVDKKGCDKDEIMKDLTKSSLCDSDVDMKEPDLEQAAATESSTSKESTTVDKDGIKDTTDEEPVSLGDHSAKSATSVADVCCSEKDKEKTGEVDESGKGENDEGKIQKPSIKTSEEIAEHDTEKLKKENKIVDLGDEAAKDQKMSEKSKPENAIDECCEKLVTPSKSKAKTETAVNKSEAAPKLKVPQKCTRATRRNSAKATELESEIHAFDSVEKDSPVVNKRRKRTASGRTKSLNSSTDTIEPSAEKTGTPADKKKNATENEKVLEDGNDIIFEKCGVSVDVVKENTEEKKITHALTFDFFDDEETRASSRLSEKSDLALNDDVIARLRYFYSIHMPSICSETKYKSETGRYRCNNYCFKIKHYRRLGLHSSEFPPLSFEEHKVCKADLLPEVVEPSTVEPAVSRRGRWGRGRGRRGSRTGSRSRNQTSELSQRGRAKGQLQRARSSRGRSVTQRNASDFSLPEGFLEILDESTSEKIKSDEEKKSRPTGRGRRGKALLSSLPSSESESLQSAPRKRSRRIQEQHQKKMSELAVEMQKEHRRLEQLAKKNTTPSRKSGPRPKDTKPKPAAKPVVDVPDDDTCFETKPNGRRRRARAVNMAKLALMYDEESKDSEHSTSRSTEKSRRRRGTRGRRRGYKPWDLSSESSSTIEELTEEEEEEEPEEQLIFNANEDEFACEEVEEDAEPVIVRRARTAKKVVEGENEVAECIVDDKPCGKCGKFDRPEWILLCDKCNDGYHTTCLLPPLEIIPDGDWFCQPCEHLLLYQCLSQELHKLEQFLKQKEREELRKQRLAYVGISLDNVLKPEKKESESASEDGTNEEEEHRVPVKKESDDEVRKKVYGKRSSRARRNVNYQFKEYDELIASAIGDELIDFKMEEFAAEAAEVEEKVSDDDDSYTARVPSKRRKVRKLNDLDYSDEDDSGDDYKGLSTDTEHTPSENTEISGSGSDAASGEWRIVKTKPRAKRRGGRARRGKYSSCSDELESDGSSYRPTTRRAAQKQISYRELSSEEEWGEALPKVTKRKKKETSSDSTSEASYKVSKSKGGEKKPKVKRWKGSSSSESEENSDDSSETEGSESTQQSASEWKIEKKSTEGGRIKININKKVVESDSEPSEKKAKPKKRFNKVISDSSDNDDEEEEDDDDDDDDDDDEEEDDDEDSSSESNENSNSAHSEQHSKKKVVESSKKVKVAVTDSKGKCEDKKPPKPAVVQEKTSSNSSLGKDASSKPKPSGQGSNAKPSIKPKVAAKPAETPSKNAPSAAKAVAVQEKSPAVTPVRVSSLPSNVAAVCRAVAMNRDHVASSQIVVKTVVVKTVPKGAIKEIKMVPSKIQYKDKIDGSDAESKKPATNVKDQTKQEPSHNASNAKAPILAKPAMNKNTPTTVQPPPNKSGPPKDQPVVTAMPPRPYMNSPLPPQVGSPLRQPMMASKNSPVPQAFSGAMMRPQSPLPQPHPFRGHPPRFMNSGIEPSVRSVQQMPQAGMPVRTNIPPQMYPGPHGDPMMQMKVMGPRPICVPPSAYSSPPVEPMNSAPMPQQQPPPQMPQTKNVPQQYSGSIVEPFSSADIDQGSDSRDEIPLERIPCDNENVPSPYKTAPYEKENEYRPAKEAASYPYNLPEEKGFPSAYSPLSSLQEFTSRPSPLKPSLVESYPSSSSPTRLTPLDSYPQSNSPKGFISLDSYPQSRKHGTYSNMNEGELRPIPSSDAYPNEARFPQEPYPGTSSPGMQNRDPGTPPRLYSQFPDTYAPPRSPEFYQGQQYYPLEEGMPRASFQGTYNPPEQVPPYSYVPNAMQQPNDGFMIDTILRARNEEDELSNVSGIVQYITQQ